MIVKKPIGAVKVGNTVSRLVVGKEVPKNVLAHWKKTEQLAALKKGDFIGEPEPDNVKSKDEEILKKMKESYGKLNPESNEAKQLLPKIQELEKR